MGFSYDFIQGINFSVLFFSIIIFVSILILMVNAEGQDKEMKKHFFRAIYLLMSFVIICFIRQVLRYNKVPTNDTLFFVLFMIPMGLYLRESYIYFFRFLEYKKVPLDKKSKRFFTIFCIFMLGISLVFMTFRVLASEEVHAHWEILCWLPAIIFNSYVAGLLWIRRKSCGKTAVTSWYMALILPGAIDIVLKFIEPELNASVFAYSLFIPILYTGVQAQEGNYMVKQLEENNMMHTIISALAYEYSTVISVDLNTDEIKIYKMNERLRNTYGEFVAEKFYTNALNMFIERFVSEEDKEKVRNNISTEFIKTHLDWPDNITLTYKNIIGRYGAQKIVRINEDVAVVGFVDRHEEIEKFNRQVYEDSLTRIRNRRYYDEKLRRMEMDALVMIDADNFKEINDDFGHVCGDIVLTALAGLLQVHIRSTDYVVRYGGDEFVIAFPEIPYEKFAEKIESIREAVENIRLTDYPDCRLTISMGGVYRHGTVEELIKIADKALYDAKDERNTIKIIKG